jgi:hypothetical protein
MENSNYNVLGFDEKTNKIINSQQSGFLYKGEKECVDVTFEDGRKITFTNNHKLLTSENKWTSISDFVLNKTKLKTGINYPLIKVKEEVSVSSSWHLKVGTLLLQITNEESYFEALSFARIIGYLCADGGVYYNKQQNAYRGVINLGHMIDVNNILDDLMVNLMGVFQKEKETKKLPSDPNILDELKNSKKLNKKSKVAETTAEVVEKPVKSTKKVTKNKK